MNKLEVELSKLDFCRVLGKFHEHSNLDSHRGAVNSKLMTGAENIERLDKEEMSRLRSEPKVISLKKKNFFE